MYFICIIPFDPGIPKHQEALTQSHTRSPQHGFTLTVAEWNFKVMSWQWTELQCWLMQYEVAGQKKKCYYGLQSSDCFTIWEFLCSLSIWHENQKETETNLHDPDANTKIRRKIVWQTFFFFFCILVATAAGIGIVSMNICTLWKAIAIQSKHLLLLPLKMSACVSSSRHSEITVTYDLIPHRYFSGINIRLNNVTYCKCVFCLLLQERHLVSLLYNLKVCVCVFCRKKGLQMNMSHCLWL